MIRRTLMQRDQELVDFEIDLATGATHVVETHNDELCASIGIGPKNRDEMLTALIQRRSMSRMRRDKSEILAAFRAKSLLELAFKGHGLSLSDQFWYREPHSTERWADINFFDNEWDPEFGSTILQGNYAHLPNCSLDVPEVTTPGHAIKAWERTSKGIYLIKTGEFPNGAELIGAKLGFILCSLLLGKDHCIPMEMAERHGKPCSVSPLMLNSNEEFADGNRVYAMADMWDSPNLGKGSVTTEACDELINAYTAIGVQDASAQVARRACFFSLSLLLDYTPGNFGAIRAIGSNEWRVAPLFDYDGSFGFPFNGISISSLCENPMFVQLFCAHRFAFLKSSWDWSWCNPRVLDGFEDTIMKAYSSCQGLPLGFAELISHLFVSQRDYVSKIVAGEE